MVEPQLLNSLIKLYATYHSLSGLAQGAHRNVRGDRFYQLHLLFGEIYEAVDGAIDELGEQIRFLGATGIPYTLGELAMLADPGIPSPDAATTMQDDWVMSLISGHKVLGQLLEDCDGMCDEAGLGGLCNLIQDELQKLQRRLYLLKSQMGI